MGINNLEVFIAAGCPAGEAERLGVYPKSVNRLGEIIVFMADHTDRDTVVVAGEQDDFAGRSFSVNGVPCIIAEKNRETADALRRIFPFTRPKRVLNYDRTIGLGDRLGIATPGHIHAVEKFDVYPVFAQQSMRELNLIGRDYQDVLDDVSFAVFREGYTRGFGADGDHLKTEKQIDSALQCGYTMITLDCSEHIRSLAGMTEMQIDKEYDCDKATEAKYADKTFTINGAEITISRHEFKRMYLVYWEAVNFVELIYRTYFSDHSVTADFEISIDETEEVTTPAQHIFIAMELQARGIKAASVAPRFCGEFQKGIDYIGSREQFERELKIHAGIAEHFGYKISIHSGSDKFSIFPIVEKVLGGRFHLKTSGTNWLEAMRVVAVCAPDLYREIHAFAYTVFEKARQFYHVTPNLNQIPDINKLANGELPALFDNEAARQLIHITYGYILNEKTADGKDRFHDRIFHVLRKHSTVYDQILDKHIGRHLSILTGKETGKGQI